MKKVTAILIGAGMRGRNAYGSYANLHPNEFQIVGVAEPNEERRKLAAEMFGIPLENQFESYKELFERERFADCAMVCTQDRMHYEPTIMAFKKGYHVFCEKPMAVKPDEIVDMVYTAKENKKVFWLCYVLRYSPFFVQLKKLLDSGTIGQLVNVQYMESVAYWHHAHSFVRGNWRNVEESSPMILAKCSHDMDMLVWLLGCACKRVHSFGDLNYFKKDNAPTNAPQYCMDGCEHRDECPYYAPYLYLEHPLAKCFAKVVSEPTDSKSVLNALEKGPYGRCVFRCDNDVVDHQIMNMEFENGVKVSFSMASFTNEQSRIVNFMGTKGQITGDMDKSTITVHDYVTGHSQTYKLHTSESGHNGSDHAMMKAFVQEIATADATESNLEIDKYIDSHLLAFAAEESRLAGNVVDMDLFKEKFIEQ